MSILYCDIVVEFKNYLDKTMKEIILDYWKKGEFVEKLAKEFEGKVIAEDGIEVNNWFGLGTIKCHHVEHHFTMINMQIEAFDRVTIKRPQSDAPFIFIRFFITENNLTLKNENNTEEFKSAPSILAYTPNFGLHIDLKKGMKLTYVVLIFQKDWLESKVIDSYNKELKKMLYSKQPFYFYTSMNYNIFSSINEIIQLTHSDNQWIKLKLNACAYDLLFCTIQQFNKVNRKYNGYNKDDLERVLKIKSILDKSDFQIPPKLETLSLEASMCVSKLSKTFKCIIGLTIFQYYHDLKMKKAMFLLETKNLSVSETAYSLGYQNCSKFSSAFKKHFNVAASEILKRNNKFS